MKLIHSVLKDLPTIMNIIGDAQRYLANLGIDQWQDGYPDETQIKLDIKNKDSYVVLSDLEEVMGTTVFTTKTETTYQHIKGGWITNNATKHGTIHRLAVSNQYRKLGLAKFVFDECEQQLKIMKIESLRIDTHEENKGMQHLLKQLSYTYCGVINLANGDKRLAYEKVL